MGIIGFFVNIPLYILNVVFIPYTGYGLNWSLSWWVFVQIPATYPFFIIYLVLSSILMTKVNIVRVD
jgi:hypothetical protein